MIYVDDMFRPAQLGRGRPAKWSHLFADTAAELEAFARRLGLRPAWLQHPGTHREHYDVTMSVRAQAIQFGAQQISYPRGTAELLQRKREAAHPATSSSECEAGAGSATSAARRSASSTCVYTAVVANDACRSNS